MSIIFSDRVRAYVRGQSGDLAGVSDADLPAAKWKSAQDFVALLKRNYIRPERVLDIGSGVGVVDLALIREFGAKCLLVDGDADGPVARKSNAPHNARQATDEFMRDNGARRLDDYQYFGLIDGGVRLPEKEFDLVISLSSWCFHYPPRWYLPYVLDHLENDGALVVDVRKRHGDWMDEMHVHFDEEERYDVHKAWRTVFKRRQAKR